MGKRGPKSKNKVFYFEDLNIILVESPKVRKLFELNEIFPKELTVQ